MRALQMKLQVPPQLYSQVHPTATRISKEPELLSAQPCNFFLTVWGGDFFEGFTQQIWGRKIFYVNVQKIKPQMWVIHMKMFLND